MLRSQEEKGSGVCGRATGAEEESATSLPGCGGSCLSIPSSRIMARTTTRSAAWGRVDSAEEMRDGRRKSEGWRGTLRASQSAARAVFGAFRSRKSFPLPLVPALAPAHTSLPSTQSAYSAHFRLTCAKHLFSRSCPLCPRSSSLSANVCLWSCR